MRDRKYVPWAGVLLIGLTITTLAQGPVSLTEKPVDQRTRALRQLGADALAIDDAAQARAAFNQLLELGRETSRLDLVWQAQHGLGRAAIAAHDPLTAIEHLDQSVAVYEQSGDTAPALPYRSLATALMMQSSSPSDQFVERAFSAAARARAGQRTSLRPRADLAAALGTGDMVVAVLIGDRHAHAWAFDRSTFIGYPLPPPAEILTAVERINAYASQQDRAGVQRIADDLMPALLGPVMDRLSTLSRVIFVMDDPLRQLAIGELPIGSSRGSPRVATADDVSLFDAITRPPSDEPTALPRGPMILVASAVAAALVIVGGWAALRRRSSIP